jgi:hypothetical protein
VSANPVGVPGTFTTGTGATGAGTAGAGTAGAGTAGAGTAGAGTAGAGTAGAAEGPGEDDEDGLGLPVELGVGTRDGEGLVEGLSVGGPKDDCDAELFPAVTEAVTTTVGTAMAATTTKPAADATTILINVVAAKNQAIISAPHCYFFIVCRGTFRFTNSPRFDVHGEGRILGPTPRTPTIG